MGIDGAKASLRIFPKGGTAAEVTRRLGREPTSSHEAGEAADDRYPGRAAPRWSLDSGLPDSESLDVHLNTLCDLVSDKHEELAWMAAAGYTMDWFCFVSADNWSVGLVMAPSLLARLATFPVALNLDIYPGGPELRLVVTVTDFDRALGIYRDALGLVQVDDYSTSARRAVALDAGRATIELADAAHAEYVDDVEVGRRTAGTIRLAFEVDDAGAATRAALDAGATLVKEPVLTPWETSSSRLESGEGFQLTLFGPSTA